MDSKTRAYLRGKASAIQPTVIIGKEGVTDGTLLQIDGVLETRELVKISCLDSADVNVKSLINELASVLHADAIQAIGRKMVLYRYSKKCKDHVLAEYNLMTSTKKKNTK